MSSTLTLRLVMLINLGHRRVETDARHICHISHLLELRLLILHLAHILQEGVALLDGTNRLRVVLRQAEHTNPVVARTHSHHADSHLRGLNGLLDKQTVYNLV